MLSKMDILFAPDEEKRRPLLVFLWIAYSLATALLISNHAPWRDEANVWLIAREVGWLDIYKEAGSHKSPSLWYYVLAVPAKLGLPYWVMQLSHWLGACFAAWIFLFKAPFSILFKATFIFSFYIAYEHAVTARVYMLTLLFMWIACWCYAKRYERPILYGCIIALLAHTSFFGMFAAVFLIVEYFFVPDNMLTRRQWCAVCIMFLGFFLSVAGLIPQKGGALYYFKPDFSFCLWNIQRVFYSAYLAPNANYLFSSGVKEALWFMASWLGALYGILTFWLLKRWRSYGLMLFLVLGWLMILYGSAFRYIWSGPRHYSFCLIYTVMVLWLGKARYRPAKTTIDSLIGGLLLVSFLFGILGTVIQGYRNSCLPFSGGKRMAEYLVERKMDNKTFVVEDIMFAISILPYMPEASLWDPRKGKSIRYLHFDRSSFKELTITQVLGQVRRKFGSSDPIYLISHKEVINKNTKKLKWLYTARGQVETFWLYLVTGSRKGHGTGL
ncbi:MAG: hypothetical protein HQL21_08005 [Candidatus Omnitrophica bacterium]|nr:hypothetical protein [Candidatus Omnitrophota bacterium]